MLLERPQPSSRAYWDEGICRELRKSADGGGAGLPGALAEFGEAEAFAEALGVEVHAVFVGAVDDAGERGFVDGEKSPGMVAGLLGLEIGIAHRAVAFDLAAQGDAGGS